MSPVRGSQPKTCARHLGGCRQPGKSHHTDRGARAGPPAARRCSVSPACSILCKPDTDPGTCRALPWPPSPALNSPKLSMPRIIHTHHACTDRHTAAASSSAQRTHSGWGCGGVVTSQQPAHCTRAHAVEVQCRGVWRRGDACTGPLTRILYQTPLNPKTTHTQPPTRPTMCSSVSMKERM